MSTEAKEKRPEKVSMMQEITERIDGSEFMFVADYTGLTVEKGEALRKVLREKDAEFHVIKNTLFRHALKEKELDDLIDTLQGPTAVVTGKGEVTEVAKTLKDFEKEHEMPALKSGALNGDFLSLEDVKALADMPPREVLLAQLVGSLNAPISGLVGVCYQKVASLCYVLKAIEVKKQEAA